MKIQILKSVQAQFRQLNMGLLMNYITTYENYSASCSRPIIYLFVDTDMIYQNSVVYGDDDGKIAVPVIIKLKTINRT